VITMASVGSLIFGSDTSSSRMSPIRRSAARPAGIGHIRTLEEGAFVP